MEKFFSHNQVKVEFTIVLGGLVRERRLGYFCPDGMRFTSASADLSVEPDLFFVSYASIDEGRVQLIAGRGDDFVEVEGSPDMVMEIVCESSVRKDTERLRELYWRAGIAEYRLVDARGPRPKFEILKYTPKGYASVRKQNGRLHSKVFDASFQLLQETNRPGETCFKVTVS